MPTNRHDHDHDQPDPLTYHSAAVAALDDVQTYHHPLPVVYDLERRGLLTRAAAIELTAAIGEYDGQLLTMALALTPKPRTPPDPTVN